MNTNPCLKNEFAQLKFYTFITILPKILCTDTSQFENKLCRVYIGEIWVLDCEEQISIILLLKISL
jgi:hypothetical protein